MWTFNFAIDGTADLMSINPLEMTNFELGGTLFGIAGMILIFLLDRYAPNRERQRPHVFTASETDVDAID